MANNFSKTLIYCLEQKQQQQIILMKNDQIETNENLNFLDFTKISNKKKHTHKNEKSQKFRWWNHCVSTLYWFFLNSLYLLYNYLLV